MQVRITVEIDDPHGGRVLIENEDPFVRELSEDFLLEGAVQAAQRAWAASTTANKGGVLE